MELGHQPFERFSRESLIYKQPNHVYEVFIRLPPSEPWGRPSPSPGPFFLRDSLHGLHLGLPIRFEALVSVHPRHGCAVYLIRGTTSRFLRVRVR